MTRTTCIGLAVAGLVGLAAAVWSAVGPVGPAMPRPSADAGAFEAQEPPVPLVPTDESPLREPDVTLAPPLPPGPVPLEPSTPPPGARLLQPEPAEVPAPVWPSQVTTARLPLVRPLPEQPAPEASDKSTWSSPQPLDHVAASAPVPPAPVARVSVPRPLPSLADTPLAAPKSRVRPSPFIGTHACTVGDCHDVTLPASVRRQLGGARTLFAVPGPDQTVLLYTPEGLERLAGRLDRSPATEGKVRRARRVCFAQAERCPVDREGRTRLPDLAVRHAGVCGDAVLVGVGDHFELWEASRWDRYLTGNRE